MQGVKKSKKMNIFLWVLQILLVGWNGWGGFFVIHNYKLIGSVWALSIFPQPFWIVLGVLQLVFSVGLVLPGILRKMPQLTALSAICLALISLLGIMLYDVYTGIGSLWGILPAIVAGFVAYKRWQ